MLSIIERTRPCGCISGLRIRLQRPSGRPIVCEVSGLDFSKTAFVPFGKEEITANQLAWVDEALTTLLSEVRIMGADKTAKRILAGERALAEISAQAKRNGGGETAKLGAAAE
jgi:hypothetical protein